MKLAIIDFNRTVYDPEAGMLIPGARAMLAMLKERMTVVLVSKNEPGRDGALDMLGIRHFFAEVIFTEKKSAELFREIIHRHRSSPGETYVIGDYIYEEITHGNVVGAKTIRFKNGKFAHCTPERAQEEPWQTVTALSEVEALAK